MGEIKQTKIYTVQDLASYGRVVNLSNGHTIKFNEYYAEVMEEDIAHFQNSDDYIVRNPRVINVTKPEKSSLLLKQKNISAGTSKIGQKIASKIICYTCITDDYDELKEDQAVGNARFIAYLSDSDVISDTWEVKEVFNSSPDPRRKARYHKLMPHLFFDCEYSIWLDGSIRLLVDPEVLIAKYLKDTDIAVFKHPDRVCLYEEARVCAERQLDDPAIINTQIMRYKREGHPVNFGLGETKVVIRRHTPKVQKFNEFWFKELNEGSRRDQISFPYVARNLHMPITYMPPLYHPDYKSDEFAYVKHPTEVTKNLMKKASEEKKKKTEIIILKFNNWEVEEPCIQSVLDHTSGDYILNVYDNYPDNLNISKVWNMLIRQSEADYICLLNSDTIVSDGWLDKLTEVFAKQEDAGAVGPTTDHSYNHQSSQPPTTDYELADFSQFILGDGKPEVLSGFCLMFPKKVYDETRGFPEDYGFYGQEVAFLDNIIELGYKQYWRKDVFVHHIGSATVKKLAREGKFDEQKERREAGQRRSR